MTMAGESTGDGSDTPLVLYTDGACSGNPGPGGWGVLIRRGAAEETRCGGAPETTNNRMELQAAIEALKNVPDRGAQRPSIPTVATSRTASPAGSPGGRPAAG